jgi:hypothetical protein
MLLLIGSVYPPYTSVSRFRPFGELEYWVVSYFDYSALLSSFFPVSNPEILTLGVSELPLTDTVTRKVMVLLGIMVRVFGFTVTVKLPPPGGAEEEPPPHEVSAQVTNSIAITRITRRTNCREQFIPAHLSGTVSAERLRALGVSFSVILSVETWQ